MGICLVSLASTTPFVCQRTFFFFFFNLLLFCLLPSHVGFCYLSVNFILPLSPEILSYHPSVSLSTARYGSAIADWQRESVSYSDGVRHSRKASADCRLICCQSTWKPLVSKEHTQQKEDISYKTIEAEKGQPEPVQFGDPIMAPLVCVASAILLCVVLIFGRCAAHLCSGHSRPAADAVPTQNPL